MDLFTKLKQRRSVTEKKSFIKIETDLKWNKDS